MKRSSKQAGVPEPPRPQRRRPKSSSSPSRCGEGSGGSARRGWMCFGGALPPCACGQEAGFYPHHHQLLPSTLQCPLCQQILRKAFVPPSPECRGTSPGFTLSSSVLDLDVPWDQLSLTYEVIMPGNLCLVGRSCSSRLELCNCCTNKHPWARGHSRSRVPGSSMPALTSGEAHVISPRLRVLWIFLHPQTRSAQLPRSGLGVQKHIPLLQAEMLIPDGHLCTRRTGQLLLSFTIFSS